MAATHVSVFVYRRNADDLQNQNGTPATNGILFSFPVNQIQLSPSTVTANGVQMNTLIAMYPNGLNQPATKYYSSATVAQISAAINAGGAATTTTTTTAAPTTTTTTTAP